MSLSAKRFEKGKTLCEVHYSLYMLLYFKKTIKKSLENRCKSCKCVDVLM